MNDAPASPNPQAAANLQIFGFAVHPETERLCRFATPHLDIQRFDDVPAFAGGIGHGPEKNLGLVILVKKTDKHRLSHAEVAASEHGKPCHRER